MSYLLRNSLIAFLTMRSVAECSLFLITHEKDIIESRPERGGNHLPPPFLFHLKGKKGINRVEQHNQKGVSVYYHCQMVDIKELILKGFDAYRPSHFD